MRSVPPIEDSNHKDFHNSLETTSTTFTAAQMIINHAIGNLETDGISGIREWAEEPMLLELNQNTLLGATKSKVRLLFNLISFNMAFRMTQ